MAAGGIVGLKGFRLTQIREMLLQVGLGSQGRQRIHCKSFLQIAIGLNICNQEVKSAGMVSLLQL